MAALVCHKFARVSVRSLRLCSQVVIRSPALFSSFSPFPRTITRGLATAAEENDESHSDFKPKRKMPAATKPEEVIKKVFLYMKGTPDAPMCGFSRQVANILKQSGVPFSARNVLEDEGIRSGIKEFSNWPTIPQLYIAGEFVGGCDIVTAEYRSGELHNKLEKAGLKPTRVAAPKTS